MSRDFDQSDARVLAEFVGLEYEEDGSGNILIVKSANYSVHWCPWSLEAPMWQRKALLDAVREKWLCKQFVSEMEERTSTETDGIEHNDEFQEFLKYSSPPEAICSAILQLEGE